MSWNVNGIRAAQGKGFLDWLDRAAPDVLGLQETKAHPDQLDPAMLAPPGYRTYWSSAERKGYSGVALFCRQEPLSVQYGLGIEAYDSEGRAIVADFGDVVVINAYFPNGGNDLSRVPYKMGFKAALLGYCERLRGQGRSVVFCGDVNTAHHPIDLARPKQNLKTTGFLPVERSWMDAAVGLGWIDSFRHVHGQEEGAYSWWSFRSGARERNVGWRIDYCFTSPDLGPQIVDAQIHRDVLGSDHCPVSVSLKLPGQAG